MASLRISDINNSMIEFVTVGAGSSVKKEFISYEDDECWVVDIYRKNVSIDMPTEPVAYNWISKTSFESKKMSISDFNEFKKEMKSKQKQEKK